MRKSKSAVKPAEEEIEKCFGDESPLLGKHIGLQEKYHKG